MTPEQLSQTIVDALTSSGRARRADAARRCAAEQVKVERPKVKEHGDYATNVALQLAQDRPACAPRELAELLAAELSASRRSIAAVEIAGPGFINITVAAAAQGEVARPIVEAGAAYGGSDALAGHADQPRVRVGQPDRPGAHRRGAVGAGRRQPGAGSSRRSAPTSPRSTTSTTTARRSTGSPGRLLAVARGRDVPEDGYVGDYIADIAAAGRARAPRGRSTCPTTRRRRCSGARASTLMFEHIKQTLQQLRRRLRRLLPRAVACTTPAPSSAPSSGSTEMGNTYEADGATVAATEKYGDDKDRVLVRSNGAPAYIAGDCAYYLDKRERGFDLCVIMLGADHHGYVGRLMAMCQAFGDKPHENLEILIGQMVNLVKDGQPLRMAKRAGTRLVHRRPDRDARRRRRPLRAGALLQRLQHRPRRRRVDPGVQRQPGLLRAVRPRPALLDPAQRPRPRGRAEHRRLRPGAARPHEREGDLLRALAEFPAVIASVAELREPHRLARYLEATAATFHRFYDAACACSRTATRRPPTCTAPACCSSTPPGSCSPAASTCSASPLPSGCDAGPRGGCAARRGRPPRTVLARRTGRRQRARRPAVVAQRRQVVRRRARGRRRAGRRPGRASSALRCTSSTRTTSGRGPAPSARRSPAPTSTTPARRSSPSRASAGSPTRG